MKKYRNSFCWLLFIAVFTSCTKDPALLTKLSSQITLSTQPVTSVTQNAATSGVQVLSGFAEDITDKGICWATTILPTINNSKNSGSSGTGFVSLNLTGLVPATTYYVRSYVTTKNETLYGDQKQFTTAAYQLATLTTTGVTNITQTSAISGGDITVQGGGMVTLKGVCWSTTQGPTLSNSKTSDGTGLGIYSSSITGLTPGTTYYVRAYATNQAGTVYGQQITFTTLGISLPTVSALTLGTVTQTTAVTSATVTADGGGTITGRGVCWSTSSSPTIVNSRTSDGNGLGQYGSTLTGLSPGTTYYLRAYVTNQAGTAYGPLTSFMTSAIQLATLTAVTISGVTRSSALISCSVTSAGGGTVTSRGVCWSTGSNPTTASSTISNGSGTGTVSASLSSLASGVTYYVRAYAINGAGTSYGALSSFRTL
jgi:hypothetical protein